MAKTSYDKTKYLLISDETVGELLYIASSVKGEVGGLASISPTENGNLVIEDIFIPQQKVRGQTECELESSGIIALYEKLLEEEYEVDKIKLWWHSHGSGSAFFSSTDNETLAEWTGDYMVGLVINHDNPDAWSEKIVGHKPIVFGAEFKIAQSWLNPVNAKELDVIIKENVEVESVVKHTPKVQQKLPEKTSLNVWQQAWGTSFLPEIWDDDDYSFDFDETKCETCENLGMDELCAMAYADDECPAIISNKSTSIHKMSDRQIASL